MPIDLRKIVFSNAEVQAALVNYCMRHNTKRPDTGISSVVVRWQTDLSSDMHFGAVDGNGEGEVLSFSNEELAVALILYCHLFKDPLPHDAIKTLDPAGDGVALTLRHGWGKVVEKIIRASQSRGWTRAQMLKILKMLKILMILMGPDKKCW